jgi:hypothetical protein
VLSCVALPAASVTAWSPPGSPFAAALAATPPPPAVSSSSSSSAPLPPPSSSSSSSRTALVQHGDLYEVTLRLLTGRTHQVTPRLGRWPRVSSQYSALVLA